MDKQETRVEASRRMILIEELYIDAHVPSEVMQLYMLLKLIQSADFSAYFSEFGFRVLHTGDINDAKEDLRWGPITDFERQVVELLREKIQLKERPYVHKPIAGLRLSG